MKNCTELDKFNLELVLQAILWYGTCFTDGTVEMYPIKECPIYLVSHDPALTNRSIIYSFKDDLDDAGIFVTEFFNDLRDYL